MQERSVAVEVRTAQRLAVPDQQVEIAGESAEAASHRFTGLPHHQPRRQIEIGRSGADLLVLTGLWSHGGDALDHVPGGPAVDLAQVAYQPSGGPSGTAPHGAGGAESVHKGSEPAGAWPDALHELRHRQDVCDRCLHSGKRGLQSAELP